MKRPIIVAAICILCAIAAAEFLYTTVFQKRVEKADIIEYVQTNQGALEQFATGLLADPPGVTAYIEWQISWYPAAGMVEFITKGSGIGSATAYEGFYYSEDDRGIFARDTEALGEVILRRGSTLPVEIVVGPALRVRQDSAGLSRHGPAAVIGGVGAGQVPIQVQADGDLRLLLRVEVNHRLGQSGTASVFRR